PYTGSDTIAASSTCSVPTNSTWNNTGNTIQFGVYSTGVFLDSNDTAYIADRNGNQILILLKGASSATVLANASNPYDIVVDTSGNVYIAQDGVPQILKVWTNGSMSTFTNISGSDDYYASYGLAIDSSNNIYISDSFANRILKLSSTGSGNATVVAGGNGYGNASNQLNFPTSLAVDANGSLYILDAGNNRIQKWLSGATMGTTLLTILVAIGVLTVDCNNYLYVGNGTTILRFPPDSEIGTTVISGLYYPTSMKFDSEVNIYIKEAEKKEKGKKTIGVETKL
ncbi:unnamed protein product, partial [Didymodactylos carnosus]